MVISGASAGGHESVDGVQDVEQATPGEEDEHRCRAPRRGHIRPSKKDPLSVSTFEDSITEVNGIKGLAFSLQSLQFPRQSLALGICASRQRRFDA